MTITLPDGPIGFRLAHELEGLLLGIKADGVIDSTEAERLRGWLLANVRYAHIHPFSELAQHVVRALEDGQVSVEECEDLLFVLSKYTTVNPHFDELRGGLQVLMGVFAGAAADRKISELEAHQLRDWLEAWHHLKGLWPYEECESLITSMLAGVNVPHCAESLIGLAAQFPIGGQAAGDGTTAPLLVGGVCAVDPDIVFQAMAFVFTGESARAPRRVLANHVERRGGSVSDRVTPEIDYLVVCDGGSPFWAFSCYGRKVERAYDLRREGHHVLIVHETDFWDAVR